MKPDKYNAEIPLAGDTYFSFTCDSIVYAYFTFENGNAVLNIRHDNTNDINIVRKGSMKHYQFAYTIVHKGEKLDIYDFIQDVRSGKIPMGNH